jgi:hypothetical protein
MPLGSINEYAISALRVFGRTMHAIVADAATSRPIYEIVDGTDIRRYELPSFDVSLRLAGDGTARIAYAAGSGIGFRAFTGAGFSTSSVLGTDQYSWGPALVLDDADRAHIVFTHADPEGGCGDTLPAREVGSYYSTNRGGGWATERFTAQIGPASIQVDNAGQAHVLVGGESGLHYYFRNQTGSWSTTPLTTTATGSPNIRRDPSTGALLVAFLSADGINVMKMP